MQLLSASRCWRVPVASSTAPCPIATGTTIWRRWPRRSPKTPRSSTWRIRIIRPGPSSRSTNSTASTSMCRSACRSFWTKLISNTPRTIRVSGFDALPLRQRDHAADVLEDLRFGGHSHRVRIRVRGSDRQPAEGKAAVRAQHAGAGRGHRRAGGQGISAPVAGAERARAAVADRFVPRDRARSGAFGCQLRDAAAGQRGGSARVDGSAVARRRDSAAAGGVWVAAMRSDIDGHRYGECPMRGGGWGAIMQTLTETQTELHNDFLPLNGTDYVEFYVGNAKQAAYFYRSAFGMRLTAYRGPETGTRDCASWLVEQGKIRLVLTTALEPEHPVAEHVRLHGDGVRDIALWVDDAESAYRETTRHGARGVREPETLRDEHGEVRVSAIATYGDTIHSFVERRNYRGVFLPGFVPIEHAEQADSVARPVGLKYIDHMVGNVGWGAMNTWVGFYRDVMGFRLY